VPLRQCYVMLCNRFFFTPNKTKHAIILKPETDVHYIRDFTVCIFSAVISYNAERLYLMLHIKVVNTIKRCHSRTLTTSMHNYQYSFTFIHIFQYNWNY